MGRRSVWSDAKLLELTKKFVPAADEVWRLQRDAEPECRLFRKIFRGTERASRGTMQGIYVCTPSGKRLGGLNSHSTEAVSRMLERALAQWRELPAEPRGAGPLLDSPRWEDSFPSDGLVLTRTARDLPASLDPDETPRRPNNRDQIWFTRDEARSFVPTERQPGAKCDVPRHLVERLVRFHLVDNVRGQTLPFARQEVGDSRISCAVLDSDRRRVRLRLTGTTAAQAQGPWLLGDNYWKPHREWPRGIRTRISGVAEFDIETGRFTSFELVALGKRWGRTANNGRRASDGEQAIGFAMSLAPPRLRVAPTFLNVYDAPWVRDPRVSRDWRGFRGTTGTATSPESTVRTWSDDENVAWKTQLPGPGTSSPIVVGDDVFVTCWSGYGLDRDDPGEIANLRRHLLCVHRKTGRIRWRVTEGPAATEDAFGGRMATHGYASSTPVCDGTHVYAFFGKAGVFAFDRSGNKIWEADVGKASSEWKTGSGSSLSLWKDLLFVNASDESHAIYALDKKTGKRVWKRATPALDQAYGVPTIAPGEDTLLLAILGEVWALQPRTGAPKWTFETKTNGALAPTIVVGDGVAYSFGGQTRNRSFAIRLGTPADGETRLQWASRLGTYVTTPLLCDGYLFSVDESGIARCASAKTGELVFKERLDGKFYGSPVRAGDAIYMVSRDNGTFVIAAKPEFELLAHNRLESDESQFDATPALSRGELFLRSRRHLYCLRKQ